ncbi:multidrug resistance protein MdtO [Bryocella elongata]|uniref:Multidrug resistance protein MdtO n=1 Tax=Bryocella elongata TaxID=863522 RepID=A0A1H6BTE0_9BACT|nr:FUSC family protein [Bryocella elongata]SEG63486.1 multidrug resistance protein MdtO [Bryocella elongata]
MNNRTRYLPSLRDRPFIERLWRDLQPTPGRLARALRITLATVLLLTIMLVLQMPFMAYGLYAIFVAAVESPSASLQTGIALVGTGTIAVGIELLLVSLTDNDPIARVLSVTIVTFLGGMIVGCTTKPNLGASWGLLFCLLIATWDRHVSETVLVSNSLWLLAALSLSVLCTVSVEYIFGSRTPVDDLRRQFALRYRSLASLFAACSEQVPVATRHEAASAVSRLAVAGANGMLDLYHAIVDRNFPAKSLPANVQLRIMVLARLMDEAAAFGFKDEAVSDSLFQRRCKRLAATCTELAAEAGNPSQPAYENREAGDRLLSRIEELVDFLCLPPDAKERLPHQRLRLVPTRKIPLIIPGAMRKPENVAFALKISLCATICYIVYHAVDWPGISTSVTTVMVTGLSTTAAMKQRLSFRLMGSITGGLLLGLGVIVFLFPFMDSITALVVLVGIVAFGIAWISGGTRFALVGANIAFAFYFVALAGPRAATELAPARDRLFGILLAILVMWVVFDWIWPVRTVTTMRGILASTLKNASDLVSLWLAGTPNGGKNQEETLRRRIGSDLAALRVLDETVEYDLGAGPDDQTVTSDLIVEASLSTAALAWGQVLFLNDLAEDLRLKDQVDPGLWTAVGNGLVAMASAVSSGAQNVLPNIEWPMPEAASNEYERTLLARYRNIRMLVSELLERNAAS